MVSEVKLHKVYYEQLILMHLNGIYEVYWLCTKV